MKDISAAQARFLMTEPRFPALLEEVEEEIHEAASNGRNQLIKYTLYKHQADFLCRELSGGHRLFSCTVYEGMAGWSVTISW